MWLNCKGEDYNMFWSLNHDRLTKYVHFIETS